MKRLSILLILLGAWHCDEAPLIPQGFDQTLNAPSSWAVFPGSDLVLISNTNINLQENRGSIVAFDQSNQTLLEETRFETVNFGARPLLDEARERIVIADFDEYLHFYQYTLTQDTVSFEQEEITPVISENFTHGLKVDEQPSDIVLVDTPNHGEVYLVANQIGTINVIDADTLSVMNLDEKDRYSGLRLRSALNLNNLNNFPARGIARLFVHPDTQLVYATNPNSNLVYIFDPNAIENEGVLSFISIAGNTSGIRSITMDSQNRGFFSHAGLQSVLMVDLSNVTDNGVSHEVIEPEILSVFPVYGLPNQVVLDPTETYVFVSVQNENTILKIHIPTGWIESTLMLSQGRGPSTLYFNDATSEIYSVDFFSNTLTRIDSVTMVELGVIQ